MQKGKATNKDGQVLGRKGIESRARLLRAARDLLETVPVHSLTASAIARAAGQRSQGFYRYFENVDELLLQLATDAAQDMKEIFDVLAGSPPADEVKDLAERFVAVFCQHRERHNVVLSIRDALADSGHQPFVEQRIRDTFPIVERLADHMVALQKDEGLQREDALARALVFFAAIERMSTRHIAIERNQLPVQIAKLKRAEVDLLSLFLTRSGS